MMKTIQEWKTGSPDEIILLKRCKNALRKIVPKVKLILYGSKARGCAGPESDYDLLVLVDFPLNIKTEKAIHAKLYEIELAEDVIISSIIHEYAQWDAPLYKAMPFHRFVDRDGIML